MGSPALVAGGAQAAKTVNCGAFRAVPRLAAQWYDHMTYTRSTSMTKAMTIAEAKAHFSECVKSAEGGETVLITRYGHAAAAVVSAKYLAALETERRKGPAQQGLAALVGRFPDGAELAAEVDRTVRDRRAPRKTPRLG